jgi:hypothetical protein
MSEKSLFRVLLKIMALAIALYGGYGLIVTLIGITCLSSTLKQFSGVSFNAPSFSGTGLLAVLVGPALCLAVGLYLFLGGDWLADAALPLNRRSGDAGESLWQRLAREAAAPGGRVICPSCGSKASPGSTVCPTCQKPLDGPGGSERQP